MTKTYLVYPAELHSKVLHTRSLTKVFYRLVHTPMCEFLWVELVLKFKPDIFADKPSRPDTLSIQDVGPDSVTLAWTPPLDDGGVSVTKYILEKCDKEKMVWAKVNEIVNH